MDLTGAPWRKSSYSGGNGGACVEVAVVPGSKEGSDYVITMRDSKDPDGPVLTFTPDEWKAFTLGVQDGEFDVEDDSTEESAPAVPGLTARASYRSAPRPNPAESAPAPHGLGEPDGINIADELARFREDDGDLRRMTAGRRAWRRFRGRLGWPA